MRIMVISMRSPKAGLSDQRCPAMMDPALNPWEFLPTQALIEEAGGTALIFRSKVPNKVDSLFGNRALVQHLARELSFGPG